ncbi:MAG: hypothetical protein V7785_21915 [Bermanella sp.]
MTIEAQAVEILGIPSVVWSGIIAAVIGSCLTLLGVFLNNRGHAKRQIALLKHEREKHQADQKSALKTAILLDVAGSFAEVLGVIPKLGDLDFTQKDIDEKIKDNSSIIAKSYLAAEEKTVDEILKFSTEISIVLVQLLTSRFAILDHQEAIKIYKNSLSLANEEKDRLLSLIKEFNFQGRTDEAQLKYLNDSYEHQQTDSISCIKSISKQKAILKPLHQEFYRKCLSEHARLTSLLVPMAVALRSELGNNGNSVAFSAALNDSLSRIKPVFDTLFPEPQSD